MSISIGVILGSSRPERAGLGVFNWAKQQLVSTPEVQYEFIDLAEVDLPFLDESIPPSIHSYQKEHTKRWADQIAALDGFIVITPEYNHSTSAVLKNALDFVYAEWNRKPMGYISYGGASGGMRAVEHLRQIATELQMVPMREQISIPIIWEAFENDQLKPESIRGDLQKVTDELLWWARLLKPARQA